jgi:hypothetical protein
MDTDLTLEEQNAFGQNASEALAKEREREAAKAEERLSTGEKVAFGVAAVFSGVVLVILTGLTIIGFIFSPITDTLLFALLMGGMGLTSYVIWRGGRR